MNKEEEEEEEEEANETKEEKICTLGKQRISSVHPPKEKLSRER